MWIEHTVLVPTIIATFVIGGGRPICVSLSGGRLTHNLWLYGTDRLWIEFNLRYEGEANV